MREFENDMGKVANKFKTNCGHHKRDALALSPNPLEAAATAEE